MADKIGDFKVEIKLVPSKMTMEALLKMLDMWQEDNPNQMVAMDNGHYRIVNVEGR